MAAPKVITSNKPNIERAVEIACKRISGRAVIYLEKIIEEAIKDPNKHDPKIVMKAIEEVMDRGLGKARQQIEQNINVNGNDALIEAINQAKVRVMDKLPTITAETTKTH